ncbi:expressed unknown protein [Seminavis robusta]|uniref:Uncharacterized protein n=1 Tax=Seminavis robusta TaxID=568900 RepID=A0A9N8E3D4_9STRA|nr:expressed unknown protein [Seminavis robusta]|eukprot:Sro484_g152290.1 n/a (398) ;mRNA; f:53084-54277
MQQLFEKKLDFGKRPRSPHRRDPTECNIFCSDLVSFSFIEKELKRIENNLAVYKLEIEDLITAGRRHRACLPHLMRVILSEKRDWLYVRFVDSFALDAFPSWREAKNTIMLKFEERGASFSPKWQDTITWRTSISIEIGTKAHEIVNLFENIKQDRHIVNLSFHNGAGEKVCPEELVQLLDWSHADGLLTSGVTVSLQCGWSGNSNKHSIKHLLNYSTRLLKRSEKLWSSSSKDSQSRTPRGKSERKRASKSKGCPTGAAIVASKTQQGKANESFAAFSGSIRALRRKHSGGKLCCKNKKADGIQSKARGKRKVQGRSKSQILPIVRTSTRVVDQEMQEIARSSSLSDLKALKRSLDKAIAQKQLEEEVANNGEDLPDYDWASGAFLNHPCRVPKAA